MSYFTSSDLSLILAALNHYEGAEPPSGRDEDKHYAELIAVRMKVARGLMRHRP